MLLFTYPFLFTLLFLFYSDIFLLTLLFIYCPYLYSLFYSSSFSYISSIFFFLPAILSILFSLSYLFSYRSISSQTFLSSLPSFSALFNSSFFLLLNLSPLPYFSASRGQCCRYIIMKSIIFFMSNNFIHFKKYRITFAKQLHLKTFLAEAITLLFSPPIPFQSTLFHCPFPPTLFHLSSLDYYYGVWC
jgi:hypothetical protein